MLEITRLSSLKVSVVQANLTLLEFSVVFQFVSWSLQYLLILLLPCSDIPDGLDKY